RGVVNLQKPLCFLLRRRGDDRACQFNGVVLAGISFMEKSGRDSDVIGLIRALGVVVDPSEIPVVRVSDKDGFRMTCADIKTIGFGNYPGVVDELDGDLPV